jgi:hypothetical protein
VTHIWTILAGANTESWQEWGPLKDNHFWQFGSREKIEKKLAMKLSEETTASLQKMTLLLNRKST